VLRRLGTWIPLLRGDGRRLITVDATAPDFTLDSTEGELTLSRRLLIGAVLLVFYRPGNQRAAAQQLSAYRDDLDVLDRLGLQLLAANEEKMEVHRILATEHRLPFPVLSDPGGQVARQYGARGLLGRTRPALVIVGRDRRVRWSLAGEATVTMRAGDLRGAAGSFL